MSSTAERRRPAGYAHGVEMCLGVNVYCRQKYVGALERERNEINCCMLKCARIAVDEASACDKNVAVNLFIMHLVACSWAWPIMISAVICRHRAAAITSTI